MTETTGSTETTETAETAGTSEAASHIGQNELGRINISSKAVEKIAALAAIEIPDAGGAAARLRARVPGAGRRRSPDRLPKVSADVDGSQAFLDVELSVLWPSPIGQVTESVRQHVARRVEALAGLSVTEVNIEVVDLSAGVEPARVS